MKLLPRLRRVSGTLVRFLRRRARPRRRLLFILTAIIVPVAIFSYLTNPFVRFSLVRDSYQVLPEGAQGFEVVSSYSPRVREARAYRRLAEAKSLWHIVSSRFTGGPKTKSQTVDEIIAEIHALRFDPDAPYLISGDHFSVLYPRSLGIFYHTALDSRTALSAEDWQNRQELYLKTTAYALDVFSQSDRLSTTIVPIGRGSVALMNIYAPPSDTLYSLLYALRVMQDETVLRETYPFEVSNAPELQTATAAAQLLAAHRDTLRRHLENYNQSVLDSSTGLVRKDILLSGTKDITKRSSAFYDNVMVWRTNQLAQELGIVPEDKEFLDTLKQKILTAFWLEEDGYFLEDLSSEGVANKYYSSDWLIALMTGFLDPRKESERQYYVRSIEYIQRNAIDQPFGLQYHPDLRRHRQYLFVRIFQPSYGSTAIWSHWGMEYVKALVLLAQVTGDSAYLEQAERQLETYAFNMKRYSGYPELYNANGDFYQQVFYKSVRRTGWVVTFEQARAQQRAVRALFSVR